MQVTDRHTTREVLKAVLHSILFHRLFGIVKPQMIEVLDMTMVRKYSHCGADVKSDAAIARCQGCTDGDVGR